MMMPWSMRRTRRIFVYNTPKKAYHRGMEVVIMVKDLIPKLLLEVLIRATVGAREAALENVKVLGKNLAVTF